MLRSLIVQRHGDVGFYGPGAGDSCCSVVDRAKRDGVGPTVGFAVFVDGIGFIES